MNDSVHCFKYLLGLARPVTQTSLAEQEVLRKHSSGRKSIVEIGVYHGVNTRAFREVCDPNAHIYAIDPFFSGRAGFSFNKIIAHLNANKCRRGNLKWIRDISPNAASIAHIEREIFFDFIFIDGDHSYKGTELDWTTWVSRLVVGGIVALHDSTGSCGAGSEKFTNNVVLTDPNFEIADTVDSLTVARRRA